MNINSPDDTVLTFLYTDIIKRMWDLKEKARKVIFRVIYLYDIPFLHLWTQFSHINKKLLIWKKGKGMQLLKREQT